MNTAEAIAEMMTKYNEARAMWIEKMGDKFYENEFHAWFTKQVMG